MSNVGALDRDVGPVVLGGTLRGTIISHVGSVGLVGSDEEDVGRRRTMVELSQS